MAKFIKKCKCCGLEFETNSPQKLFCDRDHYLPCPVCGKPVLKKDRDFTIPPKCCSPACTHKKRQQHFKMKKCEICGDMFRPTSGVNTICSKEHHMNCEICGKDMIVTSRMWHDKITTCSEDCSKEKLRRFYQSKYGVDHPMQNSEVQKHFRDSMTAKYGVPHALQLADFLDKAQQTNLDKFGMRYACLRDECKSKCQSYPISNENRRIAKMLESVGLSSEFERVLDSRAFDICIESTKTVIEVDPTYTHNSLYNHWGAPLKPDYHIKKTSAAASEGYRCIHIFEWDSVDKIVNMLRPSIAIGARKCKLQEVSLSEANEFLDKYHLQGKVRGQKYILGLYHDDQLLQVMTFGKPRYDKNHDCELLRLCTKPGSFVVGGANRLFYHAINDNPQWRSIISYCDIAKFSGDVYHKLGMSLIRTTPPQEIWAKGKDKVTASLLRQRGFDQLFNTNYGKGTSNEELMIQSGWLPVYDCGQYVFEWRRDNEKM